MLDFKRLTLGALALFCTMSLAAANDEYEIRTVVDSVRAVEMMNAEIDRINAPANQRIGELSSVLNVSQQLLTSTADSLARLKRLDSLYQPKIKDKELAAEYQTVLSEEFGRVSLPDLILKLKEANIEELQKKKNWEEKLTEKFDKEKEKQIKEAGKGHLEKTFLSVLIPDRIKEFEKVIAECEAAVSSMNDSIAGRRATLVAEVKVFDREAFKQFLPDADYPVRQLRESLAGTGRHSFAYYAEKYPQQLKNCATGRFNGMLEDRLYLFPLESSINYEYYSGTDGVVARGVIVKSEKGTVPEAVLVDNTADEGTSYFFSNEYPSGLLTTLTEFWDKDAPARDGIYLALNCWEGTASDCFTWVFDGDKWSNRPPYNPRYMTYDECQRLFPEIVMIKEPFQYRWKENDELELYEDGTLNLISVVSTDGYSFLIKSDGIDDLEVSSTGLVGFNVVEGNPRDLLALYYEGPKSAFAEVYAVSWNGPSFSSLNGVGINESFQWEKVGFVPDSNVGKVIPIRSYSNPGKDGWYEEMKYENETYEINGILKKSDDNINSILFQKQLGRWPDAVSVDEIKRNIRQFCNNVFGVDTLPSDLNDVQSERLLSGAAFQVPSGAMVEGWTPIAGNILLEIVSKPEKEEFSEDIVQHRYLALYSPNGELKDAVWIGKFFPEEEKNSKDFSKEHTAFCWLSPRRFKIQAYKMVESAAEYFSGFNELEYIVADDRFVVTSYLWNIGECSVNYVWAYMEPVSFLKRFPLKSTPWDLWYKYSRHTDGENGESLYEWDLYELYRRNPEMFLKKAAKVFSAKENKDENMAYKFFDGGMFLDYYPDESKPLQENIKKYLTPVESSGLLRAIGR